MQKLCFNLDCIPPRVTKQMKKTIFRGGRPRHIDTPELEEAMALYMGLLLPNRPANPLAGPVRLLIAWTFPHLETASQKKKLTVIHKDTAPDLDNMEKMLIDIMAKMGFVKNDGQIADKRTLKFWGPVPGIKIELEEIGGNHESR